MRTLWLVRPEFDRQLHEFALDAFCKELQATICLNTLNGEWHFFQKLF